MCYNDIKKERNTGFCMNIAICDDEKVIIEEISNCVNGVFSKYGKECNIIQCLSGKMLVENIEKQQFDAVFLDIDMPEMNGFELAKSLNEIDNNINIIFVSGKENMVFMSYEYRPFWFVPKSNMSMLEFVVDRLVQKLYVNKNNEKSVSILIEPKKDFVVDFEEILYFKTQDHYINVVLKNNKNAECYRNKIENIEKQLAGYWFVRVHNRYLVNCRMIGFIEKNSCRLVNEEQIPISRSKMANVKKVFQDYFRSIR